MAYRRFLQASGSLADVGPTGVAVWGHHLAYGVALGVAPVAERALTPEV
jgi:uncharacterized membrane protein